MWTQQILGTLTRPQRRLRRSTLILRPVASLSPLRLNFGKLGRVDQISQQQAPSELAREGCRHHPARAQFERIADFAKFALAGEDNHRHVARADDFGQHINAANARHVEIEQHDINRLMLDKIARQIAAIERVDNLELRIL